MPLFAISLNRSDIIFQRFSERMSLLMTESDGYSTHGSVGVKRTGGVGLFCFAC